jgi:hypothetical protein
VCILMGIGKATKPGICPLPMDLKELNKGKEKY